jgi:hypothetical protein
VGKEKHKFVRMGGYKSQRLEKAAHDMERTAHGWVFKVTRK